MSVLTLPVQPGQDAGPALRPVPWQRMLWVTWRQHRGMLVSVTAVLAAVSAFLLIAGLKVHHDYAALVGCHAASSDACATLKSHFNNVDWTMGNTILILMNLAPALLGIFTGPAVLARELETGTFRYAWTQAFGRWRWAVAKLVLLAVAVTAAAGAFSALFSWYNQPFFAAGYVIPLSTRVFDLHGIAFAAWTLAAFAIGALAGMLIRRVVPAIAATLVVYAGLAFATGLFLRGHYLTPLLTTSLTLPGSAFLLSQWWTKGGVTLSQSTMHQVMDPVFQRFLPAVPPDQVHLYKGSTLLDTERYLTQHGYTYWTSYQPGSRFWPFQWIEGGWLLALSVLLIAATIWLVRRRAT